MVNLGDAAEPLAQNDTNGRQRRVKEVSTELNQHAASVHTETDTSLNITSSKSIWWHLKAKDFPPQELREYLRVSSEQHLQIATAQQT